MVNKTILKEWIEDILEKFDASPAKVLAPEPSSSQLFVYLKNMVASRLQTHLLERHRNQTSSGSNQITPHILQELMHLETIEHLHHDILHDVRTLMVQDEEWFNVAQGVVRRQLRAESLQRPTEELISMDDLLESLNHTEDNTWDDLTFSKYDKLPEYVQRLHAQYDLQIRLEALQELQQFSGEDLMGMMQWECLLDHVLVLVLDVLNPGHVQLILLLYWKLFQASADEQASKIYCSVLRFTAHAFDLSRDHHELQPLLEKGLRMLHYFMVELAGIWNRLNRHCFNEIQVKTFMLLQYLCANPLDSALSALHEIDPQLVWFRKWMLLTPHRAQTASFMAEFGLVRVLFRTLHHLYKKHESGHVILSAEKKHLKHTFGMLVDFLSYEEGRRVIHANEIGGVSLKIARFPNDFEKVLEKTLEFEFQPGTNRRIFSLVHPVPLVKYEAVKCIISSQLMYELLLLIILASNEHDEHDRMLLEMNKMERQMIMTSMGRLVVSLGCSEDLLERWSDSMNQLGAWIQDTKLGKRFKYEAEERFLRLSVLIQLLLIEQSTPSKYLESIIYRLSGLLVLVFAEMETPTLDFTGDAMCFEVLEITLVLGTLALQYVSMLDIPWLTLRWVGQVIAILHANAVAPRLQDQLQSMVNALLASSQHVCNIVTTHTLALNLINRTVTSHNIYCLGNLFTNSQVVDTFIASIEFLGWLENLPTCQKSPSEDVLLSVDAIYVACIGFPEVSHALLTSEHHPAILFRNMIQQFNWSDTNVVDNNIPSIWISIVQNMLTSVHSGICTLALARIQADDAIQGTPPPMDALLLQLQFYKSRYNLGTSNEVPRPLWNAMDASDHSIWNHNQKQLIDEMASPYVRSLSESPVIPCNITQVVSESINQVKNESRTRLVLSDILSAIKEADLCTQMKVVGKMLLSPSQHVWMENDARLVYNQGKHPWDFALGAWKRYCNTLGIACQEERILRSRPWDWGNLLWATLEVDTLTATAPPKCLQQKSRSELNWITHGVEIILSTRYTKILDMLRCIGLSPSTIVFYWHSQCFFNVLDFTSILHYVMCLHLLGPIYQPQLKEWSLDCLDLPSPPAALLQRLECPHAPIRGSILRHCHELHQLYADILTEQTPIIIS